MCVCLQAQHDEQVAALEAQLRTLTEELNEAQSGLKGRDETVQELRDQVASLQQQSAELEATQGKHDTLAYCSGPGISHAAVRGIAGCHLGWVHIAFWSLVWV